MVIIFPESDSSLALIFQIKLYFTFTCHFIVYTGSAIFTMPLNLFGKDMEIKFNEIGSTLWSTEKNPKRVDKKSNNSPFP